MVQIVPNNERKSSLESVLEGLNSAIPGIQDFLGKRESQRALLEENQAAKRLGIDLSGIRDPDTRKVLMLQSLKLQEQGNKSSNNLLKNKNILSDLEQRRGLDKGSLNAYQDDPSMAERISRPEKIKSKRLSEIPIDPEQKQALDIARNVPGYDEMDEVGQYRTMIDKGVSPELAEKESKLTSSKLERNQKSFDKSYESQKDFIDETTSKYKGFETEMKPRLLQMQNMDPEKIIGPTASVFLDHLGIPLGALEDPSSELYNKLSQDLLKGLPDTYGNRILKVEVDNFLKTIPTLTNSVEGRRMIASNMLKLGEMKEVYYNEMRKQQKESLDTGKNLPKDFQQRVFDQVKPQIDRINNEFVKMSEVTAVPKDTIPFFTPSGDVKFVPKNQIESATKSGGRRIW